MEDHMIFDKQRIDFDNDCIQMNLIIRLHETDIFWLNIAFPEHK